MALHFVTASQNGVKHVQSYNDAHYNAGTLGNGCYILPVRDKLQASMPDSNTVRILGGDFVVCGRHIAIDGGYEEVNIDNGIPGYNRIDLVVARVETAPSEKAELKVYKGEETTGTPVVPGHVEGDLNDGDTVCEMPICSVRINGINPQAPEMLAKESPTITGVDADLADLLKAFQDYKSQMLEAKGIGDGAITSAKIKDGTIAKGDLAVALQTYLGNCVHRTYAAGAGLATYLVEGTASSGSISKNLSADFTAVEFAVAQVNEDASSIVANACITSGTTVTVSLRKVADGAAYAGACRVKLLVLGTLKG